MSSRTGKKMGSLARGIVLGGALVAVAASCAETSHEATVHTTSAGCMSSGSHCTQDADCCSIWCVGGECQRRQP
jgi:hypothetical protein